MDSGGGSSKPSEKDDESALPSKPITLPTDKNVKPEKLTSSSKGIENAKKRLRAFSIQKKTAITPIVVPKATSSTNTTTTTVIIGKLTGVKVTPKVEPDPELKKLKPPKPGASRRAYQDSYVEVQKRTLSEIEDMKRKMELVELGIPLGLICPTSTNEKAMPTKAMPPIKSLLDPAKVDELIREAKKAKQEGKEYKFDYQKLLPDYDNPFQKKKEEQLPQSPFEKERRSERRRSESERDRDKDRRRSEKYDGKRHDYKKDGKHKERNKDRRYDESQRDNPDDKETDVNLNDYLVCDSWSLENDDKNSMSSPKALDKPLPPLPTDPIPEQKIPLPPDPVTPTSKKSESLKTIAVDSPKTSGITVVPIKIEKLKPVIDSFKYEIDSNEDEVLDIFDEDSDLDKYTQETKKRSYYESPDKSIVDYDQDNENSSMDGINDDTFMESVIREIKQENLSDEESQDRGLVEYEMSPNKESPEMSNRGSVTPEIDYKLMNFSQRSDYSEGYKSDSYKSVDTVESGYKSVESDLVRGYKSEESGYKSVERGYKSDESGYKPTERGYKSEESGYKPTERGYKSEESDRYKPVETFRLSVEKELDEALEAKMSKSTVDSLETWSFVLKICQPLLFRHDKNKCYKETRTCPKLWFTENPKACDCVKDRGVVYDELEMCKMALVDRVYGCDQIPDAPFPKTRRWYPRSGLHSTENTPVPLSSDWEAEDSQTAERSDAGSNCTTPLRNDESLSLDREYQRFMEAVWPDVVESKAETSRSTTPVRQESRKKKKEQSEKEEEKKPKKIKLNSEGWSQESDVEEEDKSKKQKMEKQKVKSRKRKHSSSTLSSGVSETDEDARKKRKMLKKKAIKKTKSKSAKRRRMGRKLLKKLKEKQKKSSKEKDIEADDSDKKKEKKSQKKKQQKLKKKELKKKKIKAQSSSSSSSSSDSSDSESEGDRKSKKAKKKGLEGKKVKKLRKQSTSDSTQSEELFDVNILNNIKTERLTDDEIVGHKMMEFSPRRQKPREIINVKELQNDFVGNIHIKQEAIDDIPEPNEPPKSKELLQPKESPTEVQKAEITKIPETEESLDSKAEVAKVIELPKVSPQAVKPPQKLSPLPPQPVPAVPQPASEPDGQTVSEPVPPQTVPLPQNIPIPTVPQTVPLPQNTPIPTVPQIAPIPVLDESNMSQTSSQESVCSIKDAPIFYEKDESHLRPSSQNSNYSFNDVINASQNNLYQKDIKPITAYQNSLYDKEIELNVDQSLYPKEIETISSQSDHTKLSDSQNDYQNISAVQSDYNKISAIQSDYSKIPASSSDYTKMTASQGDYPKMTASQSDYTKMTDSQSDYTKMTASQSDYTKMTASQSDYTKMTASQSDYTKMTASQSDYPKMTASQSDYTKMTASQSDYGKRIEVTTSENSLYNKDLEVETECDDKYGENYEAANYEMYEQMAMAYQSDVASQQRQTEPEVCAGESRRIETVVGARAHGEIKCDWRAGDAPATPRSAQRPSRWGLKPGEVNIVLTGGGAQFASADAAEVAEPVYRIQSLANRSDISIGYDEAYMDMYGAADRLQYGDCFSDAPSPNAHPLPPGVTRVPGNIQHISPNIVPVPASVTPVPKEPRSSALDERINKALRETVLGGIAKELDGENASERGTAANSGAGRAVKRVSFADGYKPGQDSDVEEPPTKRRKRARRTGCAWPCPASHPDHVPLWDALPPPPPPPGSPPPPRRPAPPLQLLRAAPRRAALLALPALPNLPTPPARKFDPAVPLTGFMPPEPPPGLIALQSIN